MDNKGDSKCLTKLTANANNANNTKERRNCSAFTANELRLALDVQRQALKVEIKI